MVNVVSTYKMMLIACVWLEVVSATRGRHKQARLAEEHQLVECGEIIQNRSNGQIQSPNYPVAYPPNCDCKWSIYAQKGEVIRLKIIDIELEVNQKLKSFCPFDYISVRGLPGLKPRKICRPPQGTTLESSSNKIEILFHSDTSNQRPGFRIVFMVVKDPKAAGRGDNNARPAIPESTTTQALTKAVTTPQRRKTTTTTTDPVETTTTLQLTTQVVTKARTPRRRTARPTRVDITTTAIPPPPQQRTPRPGEIVAESDKLFIDGKNNKQVDTWLIVVVVVVGSSIIFFLLTSLCLFIADHK